MKPLFQSIRIKLVLLLLAVGLVPLLVGTTVSYITSMDALMEKVGHELQLETDHVAFAVEAIFSKAQSNLLVVSQSPAFVMYFKDPERREFWRAEQERALTSLQALFPGAEIDEAFLSPSGREISTVLKKGPPLPGEPSPPQSFQPPWSKLPGGKVFQGHPYVSPRTHLWSIPFIAPVFDGNTLRGFIQFDINLEYFSAQLRGNISSDNHAFIIERSGKILAQTIISIGETRDLPDAAEMDSSPLYKDIVRRALAGEKNREYLTTSMGREYLTAFQPTHSGLWSVLVFMPSTNARMEILPLGRIPMIFAGTFIIILVLALFIGERISDPIKEVVSGTRTLSEGDFSHRIHVALKDEMGDLGHAFNAMAEHLQKREDEILRRNRELSSLNLIATTVNQSLDVEESLSAVLSKVLEVTGATAGGIYLLKEKHTLTCQVHSGLSRVLGDLFRPQRIGEGWVGLAARAQEPLIWNELLSATGKSSSHQEGPTAPVPEEILRAGFRSSIGLPLRFKNKVNGVICLLGETPHHFDSKKVEFLSSIGSQIAVAIENTRLFANLEKAYEELKATHAQLIQSAKLAAVGELAAGVAHELNQPLMVIRGHAQEILDDERRSLPETLQKDLKLIENQTTRMMRIIGHLRAFARQSSGTFEPLEINAVIESSFTLVTQQLKNHNIVIVMNLAENLPRVWGDATRVEQVLLNLITNARDAMEDRGGGTLTVGTRVLYKEQGEKRPVTPEVEITFTDTGSGIPQKYLDKIFDPFFTTKEVGKGTGLGLSIGYSIIKDHGGSIRAESRIGAGTTFILRFPVEKRRTPRKTGREKEQDIMTRRH